MCAYVYLDVDNTNIGEDDLCFHFLEAVPASRDNELIEEKNGLVFEKLQLISFDDVYSDRSSELVRNKYFVVSELPDWTTTRVHYVFFVLRGVQQPLRSRWMSR